MCPRIYSPQIEFEIVYYRNLYIRQVSRFFYFRNTIFFVREKDPLVSRYKYTPLATV